MDFPFILYSATLAYMVSGVICGFIRWFHMCKPFDQQPQFAYPARRALSIFYGLTLMLAPCLFDLNGTDCHVFLHSFFAIIYPCCFSWLFRRYFDFLGMFNWSYYLVPGLNFIYLTVLFVVAVLPGEQFASHTQDIILTSTAVAIVSFANLVNIMVHIVGMVKKISEDNYSNTEDFPIDFAKAALLGSLVLCLLTLPTLLIPNDALLSIGILLFAIGNVAFLIGCLHPHRNLAAEANKLKKEKTEEKAAKESMEAEPGKDSLIIQALRPRIEKVFTEYKIYLNPNLTISDVARAIGSNRTYTSMVFRAEFGSFLIYVNNMRIRHALQLQQEHPGWKQVELYQSSGFNNRSSYKKWLAYYLNKNKSHG